MRHRHKGRKLNRTWSHKKALLRNMVTTFLDLERIETTDAKAKEVRSLAERLITLGKRGSDDLAARRQALKVIRDKKVVAKLFDELGPRYAERPGGYTRIIKVDERRGDGAQLSIIQLVTEPVTFKDMKHKRARQEEEASLVAATLKSKAAPEGGEEETQPEAGEPQAAEVTEETAAGAEEAPESEEPEAETAPEEPKGEESPEKAKAETTPEKPEGNEADTAEPEKPAEGSDEPASEEEPETPEKKEE
jgi:large subunit ribosomal protein L17